MMWNEVTAVLGGTFDPPHLGHREAVRGLFDSPGVRQVLVIPSGAPPLKAGATSAKHRARMTELCLEDLAGPMDVKIDLREIEKAERNGKPTYTIDTLLELKRGIPQLAFVTGAEQLAQLHVWHRFPEVLEVAHWLILARRPDGEATAMRTLQQWESSGLIRREAGEWVTSGRTRIKLVATPAPDLSSSTIREEIARSTDPAKLAATLEKQLHPAVLAYLMEHRIYGMSPP